MPLLILEDSKGDILGRVVEELGGVQGIPQASASLLREGGRVADRIPLSVFEENTRIIRDHTEDIE